MEYLIFGWIMCGLIYTGVDLQSEEDISARFFRNIPLAILIITILVVLWPYFLYLDIKKGNEDAPSA